MNTIFCIINKRFVRAAFTAVCLIAFMGSTTFAQKTNGTVISIVKTEDYLNKLVAKKGINQAYIDIAEQKGVTFEPNPLNIKDYYANQQPVTYELDWKPNFAAIAKSGYFGFTTGLYTIKNDEKLTYGHYLHIWKAESNKKWLLALNATIEHEKPPVVAKPKFIDPSNYKYSKLIGPKKIKMREEIVFSTDLLFSKALIRSGNENFEEFYADDVRLYFPGELPLIGKEQAINFVNFKNQKITSTPTFVDRAISGDLAYTNGKATIGSLQYNYARIWKIGEDSKWYILVDMYIAE